VRLLFINEKSAEDRTLIHFINEGMYDLCVDTGDEVIQVTDEVGFEKSREPNTKFVMRVVLTQEAERVDVMMRTWSNTYTCPRCKKKTKVKRRSTISIDWYTLLISNYDLCC